MPGKSFLSTVAAGVVAGVVVLMVRRHLDRRAARAAPETMGFYV